MIDFESSLGKLSTHNCRVHNLNLCRVHNLNGGAIDQAVLAFDHDEFTGFNAGHYTDLGKTSDSLLDEATLRCAIGFIDHKDRELLIA